MEIKTGMKNFLVLMIVGTVFSVIGVCLTGQTVINKFTDSSNRRIKNECPENLDQKYNRQKILEELNNILKISIPAYAQFPFDGFFVFDLTEPSNKYIPAKYAKAEGCIDLINNHIYHFSTVDFAVSQSHIAFLEDGKLKIFKSINCQNGNENLEDVISYVEKKLKNSKNKDEILTRLKYYRRYGFYFTVDSYRVACNSDEKIPENSDKLYDRQKILNQFSNILQNVVSEKVTDEHWYSFVEESRASGFFVYDLTEPSNKQTSLLERVELKDKHIYHFASIYSPFSFSHIAFLENGKIKVFNTINCEGKGDSLEDVITYLNEKLKNDKNKREIIKRVKDYRKYGVYTSYNNLSTPQCGEVIKPEK